jgi:hypothetical protein
VDDVDRVMAFLRRLGADVQSHSGRTLTDHLRGTYQILDSWKCPRHLCLAGLCHSVYGTASFEPALVDRTDREQLRAVLGPAAEELVFLFARCLPAFIPDAVRGLGPLLDQEWTPLDASATQLRDLALLALANLVEQQSHSSQMTGELVTDLVDSLGLPHVGTHQDVAALKP